MDIQKSVQNNNLSFRAAVFKHQKLNFALKLITTDNFLIKQKEQAENKQSNRVLENCTTEVFSF